MFSATVSVGASVSSWLIATMPLSIASRGPAKLTGSPSTSIVPSSGWSAP